MPTPLVPFDGYRLLNPVTIRQPRRIQARLEPPSNTLIGIEINAGNLSGIRFYEPTNATAALRNRAALILHNPPTPGAPTVVAIHLGTEIGSLTRHTVASAIVPGVVRTYLISGLNYSLSLIHI